ncbi:MAG: type II toxin-antitoxin system CcdA family antitoxin [Phenylobacterium sp.]|uniref:type II toxin-antitoxin system CcdA family antitoxin n=1 Tax=Phenylobacterium sp. TaxID=1871053 RepID=UPI0027335F07|nr:type II toxin-antitoxin system CcdA family antitoxin [Phenylobacterium sp.]MDP3747281.1 type II toxin-antitoxin system CcdA family antitoxin [Phenylobacterium sp.]
MGKAELKIEIDEDLLARAKESGRPISALIEAGLRATGPSPSGEERARRWAEENAEAIAEYNRRIAERGLIGDKLRKW